MKFQGIIANFSTENYKGIFSVDKHRYLTAAGIPRNCERGLRIRVRKCIARYTYK